MMILREKEKSSWKRKHQEAEIKDFLRMFAAKTKDTVIKKEQLNHEVHQKKNIRSKHFRPRRIRKIQHSKPIKEIKSRKSAKRNKSKENSITDFWKPTKQMVSLWEKSKKKMINSKKSKDQHLKIMKKVKIERKMRRRANRMMN